MARGIAHDPAQQTALALLNGMVQQQAAVIAFDYTFYVVGALFILALPLVLLLPSARDMRRVHEESASGNGGYTE